MLDAQVDVQIHVLQMDAGVAAVGLNAAMLAVAAAGASPNPCHPLHN